MGRALDELLETLPVSPEEVRAIKILLQCKKPVQGEVVGKEYEKKFKVKIGSKIYHVLNNLRGKKLVNKEIVAGKKLFSCNEQMLSSVIRENLKREQEKLKQKVEKLEFVLGKPSLTTHVGTEDIANVLTKVFSGLEKGGKIHMIKDTFFLWGYPETKDKKWEEKNLRELDKVRETRGLEEYLIFDKEKSEDALKALARKFGKGYVKERLLRVAKLLETDSFNMAFGKNLHFKFIIIPSHCAVTGWHSAPQKELDRAIVFWYPDDVKGLDEYFWAEWKRNLNGKSELEAKKEAKEWVNDLLKKF